MDILPLVIEFVLLEDIVQESQSASLAAYGTGPQAREPDGVVESIGVEGRDDSKRLRDTVVVYDLEVVPAVRLDVGVVLGTDGVKRPSKLEDTPGIEPLGKVVLVSHGLEHPGRDVGQKVLELIEVPGAADLYARRRVDGHEISETELTLYVLLELLEEHLGGLADETYSKPCCH